MTAVFQIIIMIFTSSCVLAQFPSFRGGFPPLLPPTQPNQNIDGGLPRRRNRQETTLPPDGAIVDSTPLGPTVEESPRGPWNISSVLVNEHLGTIFQMVNDAEVTNSIPKINSNDGIKQSKQAFVGTTVRAPKEESRQGNQNEVVNTITGRTVDLNSNHSPTQPQQQSQGLNIGRMVNLQRSPPNDQFVEQSTINQRVINRQSLGLNPNTMNSGLPPPRSISRGTGLADSMFARQTDNLRINNAEIQRPTQIVDKNQRFSKADFGLSSQQVLKPIVDIGTPLGTGTRRHSNNAGMLRQAGSARNIVINDAYEFVGPTQPVVNDQIHTIQPVDNYDIAVQDNIRNNQNQFAPINDMAFSRQGTGVGWDSRLPAVGNQRDVSPQNHQMPARTNSNRNRNTASRTPIDRLTLLRARERILFGQMQPNPVRIPFPWQRG